MKKLFFLIFSLIAILFIFIESNNISTKNISNTRIIFKDYHLKEYSLKLILPDTTIITESNLNKGEILFNTYLNDKKLGFWGYIQLWNLHDLDKFLKNSKSTSILNFTSYKQEKIQVKSFDGFQVNWTAIFQNQKTYAGREFFLKKNNSKQVLRLSFFSENSSIPKELEQIINKIVLSIEWD